MTNKFLVSLLIGCWAVAAPAIADSWRTISAFDDGAQQQLQAYPNIQLNRTDVIDCDYRFVVSMELNVVSPSTRFYSATSVNFGAITHSSFEPTTSGEIRQIFFSAALTEPTDQKMSVGQLKYSGTLHNMSGGFVGRTALGGHYILLQKRCK